MIKRWNEFIREFVEYESNFVADKMQELQKHISDITDVESGSSLMYNWKVGEDEHLVINFTIDDIPYKYELDLKKDTPYIVKEYIDNQLVSEEQVQEESEGLDLIDKKIRDILSLYEGYIGNYDSSLTEEVVKKVTNRIRNFAKIEVIDNTADVEGLVEELQEALSNYDKETIDLVIDTTLFCDDSDRWEDWAVEQIIQTGDKIMKERGTEPMQLLNAYDTVFNYLSRHFNWEDKKFIESYQSFSEIELIIEGKNKPTNSKLWAACTAWAKSRYDVWPSAYACGAAAKRYKSKGGKWRKKKNRKKNRK